MKGILWGEGQQVEEGSAYVLEVIEDWLHMGGW